MTDLVDPDKTWCGDAVGELADDRVHALGDLAGPYPSGGLRQAIDNALDLVGGFSGIPGVVRLIVQRGPAAQLLGEPMINSLALGQKETVYGVGGLSQDGENVSAFGKDLARALDSFTSQVIEKNAARADLIERQALALLDHAKAIRAAAARAGAPRG